MLTVGMSPIVCNLSWKFTLGVVTLRGVDCKRLEPALEKVYAGIRAANGDVLERVLARIAAFEEYFTSNGWHFPLRRQLEGILKRPPSGGALVRALLLAETSTGVLMGAHSLSALKGDLLCDLAAEGETFVGIRNTVRCRTNEIVLRDAEGIIASVFQGPDQRTLLKKESKNVVFFLFGAPSVTGSEVEAAAKALAEIFRDTLCAVDIRLLRTREAGSGPQSGSDDALPRQVS
jgi:hypothetical protein